DTLTVTLVQDTAAPSESSNAYVITSRISNEGFFVDSGSTNSTTSQLISVYQQQVRSTTKPPKFVFLIHGHPDHMGGIALIQKSYPTTPIYVIIQQVAREAVRWIDFVCSNGVYSPAQCTLNYIRTLRVLSSPRTQLAFNDLSARLTAMSVMVKGESSYAGMLGIASKSRAYLLFTGDAITIRSHLYVSNFFDTNTLPSSDDALCAWAGSMQSTVCSLQLGSRMSRILPGHGPISDSFSYPREVARNIGWLRTLQTVTFNSCNATYIWSEMLRRFPDFGE
ncbi:unnamed protein product, partial [Rotaria sp. Silwood2]